MNDNSRVTETMQDSDWKEALRFQTKYQQQNPLSRKITDRFLQRIVGLTLDGCPAGGSMLDVGCGEGINLYHILQVMNKLQLHGIDISEESLDIARKMAPQALIQHGSVYDLPYEDKAFDLVICTEVLEHLEDPEKGLREVHRVAKNRVILSVPREPLWRILNMARGSYWSRLGNTEGHVNHWSKRAFLRFVNGCFSSLKDVSVLPWTIVVATKS